MWEAAGGHPAPNTNEKLKRFIASSTDAMWKDEGFLLVVNAYLESTRRALEFYSSVDACLTWARDTRLMIFYMYELYERELKMESSEESRCTRMLKDQLWLKQRGGNALGEYLIKVIGSVYNKEEGKAYMRVLEEMERAEATRVEFPAKDEMRNLYGLVHTEQRVLVNRSDNLRSQLVKKLARIKRWRKASTTMFAIGFFTVPVLSALVMIVPVPSAVEVLIGAFSATIGSIGKWCTYLWNKREGEAEFEKDGLGTIQKHSYLLLNDMETMQKLVEEIFLEIEFLVQVRKYMRGGAEPDRETIDKIGKIMCNSDQMFERAQDHSCLGHASMAHASRIVSERLSSVTPTITPKRRSWMDIFM